MTIFNVRVTSCTTCRYQTGSTYIIILQSRYAGPTPRWEEDKRQDANQNLEVTPSLRDFVTHSDSDGGIAYDLFFCMHCSSLLVNCYWSLTTKTITSSLLLIFLERERVGYMLCKIKNMTIPKQQGELVIWEGPLSVVPQISKLLNYEIEVMFNLNFIVKSPPQSDFIAEQFASHLEAAIWKGELQFWDRIQDGQNFWWCNFRDAIENWSRTEVPRMQTPWHSGMLARYPASTWWSVWVSVEGTGRPGGSYLILGGRMAHIPQDRHSVIKPMKINLSFHVRHR